MWRLILPVITLLISLLTVLRAPTNFLWRMSVAVTEFPWIFIFTSILLLVLSFWASKYKMTLIGVNSFSLILFFIPIVQTYRTASDLPDQFSKVFPIDNYSGQLETPFSFFKMFSGILEKEIPSQSIVYKNLPERNLSFDFYPAPLQKKSPCVIVIHGGSWTSGDSKQLSDLNSYLAIQGYNVAGINYRFAPQYKCPAPIEDTKDLISYLTKNSAQLNIDTNNFILIGRSAGGQIALLTAYTSKNTNIKGVVAFYAPADMVWGGNNPGNKWVLDSDKVLGDYVGGSAKEVPEKYKASSPFEFVESSTTPTLSIHGDMDVLVSIEHSKHLHAKLDQFNVKNYFLRLPWATHGTDFNLSGPGGQVSTYTIERFINSVISK